MSVSNDDQVVLRYTVTKERLKVYVRKFKGTPVLGTTTVQIVSQTCQCMVKVRTDYFLFTRSYYIVGFHREIRIHKVWFITVTLQLCIILNPMLENWRRGPGSRGVMIDQEDKSIPIRIRNRSKLGSPRE